MSNPDRNKNLGFTLTELMVVIVILCCLATWVPMAWITPDKPKDLKAIEHLRAHAYLHNAFFGMTRRYPQLNGNMAPFPNDQSNYERLVTQKNPAISTNVRFGFQSSFSFFALQAPPANSSTGGPALNQLTLEVTSVPPGSGLRVLASESDWTRGSDSGDGCDKNSPIKPVVFSPFTENPEFCGLDDADDPPPFPPFVYNSITVGPGTTLTDNLGEQAVFNSINGQDVMIGHRCMGLAGPSSTIYIVHVAGGETIATAHIPGNVVKKALSSESGIEGLIAAVVFACEDPTRNIRQVIEDFGVLGVIPTDITPVPGF